MNDPVILHLTLKKYWFDMIASGEKKEEYREIKPYWDARLIGGSYDQVIFTNGYSKTSPRITVELKEIIFGIGVREWGAPEKKQVYILKLGKILSIERDGTK